MSWFNRLERTLSPFAISNLTLYLVIGQTFVYLALFLNQLDHDRLVLVPNWVMEGEVWRLLTFVFDPPNVYWVFFAFAIYFFYFIGNSLEGYWGALRYNLFILVGYLLTVGLAFVTPDHEASNVFIGGAVFLAFAYLNPEFVMYLFFIIPVKIKWLAWLAWFGYAWTFVMGSLSARLAVLAAVGNFFLFFGRDIWLDMRLRGRRMSHDAKRFADEGRGPVARHTCHVCQKTDLTNPEMDFRYCSKCAGDQCYCPEHIRAHEHVTGIGSQT